MKSVSFGICLAASALSAFLLCGCGKSNNAGSATQNSDGSDIDDQPLLAQTWLTDQPMTLSVNLADAALQDQPADILALLVKSGSVTIEGQPSGPPWWRFVIKGPGITAQGDVANYEVGTPKITDRTEKRYWKEGPIEHFAETVQFDVPPSAAISGSGIGDFGPFKVRFVWTNDPRVGHWQWDQGTTGNDFTQQIQANIISTGQQYLPELRAKVGKAQLEAYDTIEKNLADSGIIARGPTSDTLVSKSNHLIWYKGLGEIQGRTWGELPGLCASVRSGGFSAWQVPTTEQMLTLLRPAQQNSFTFQDTPDRRLFGSVIPQPYAGSPIQITFITADAYSFQGQRWNSSMVPQSGQFFSIVTFFQVGYEDLFTKNNEYVSADPRSASLVGDVRALCVASYGQKQGEQSAEGKAPSSPSGTFANEASHQNDSSGGQQTSQANGPSFSCQQAETWSEKQICATPLFYAQDKQVAALYFSKLRSGGLSEQQRSEVRTAQRAWLKARENCSTNPDPSKCLSKLYQLRIGDLSR